MILYIVNLYVSVNKHNNKYINQGKCLYNRNKLYFYILAINIWKL